MSSVISSKETRQKLIERFIRYVKMDTTSDPNAASFPSTSSQFELANLLVNELHELGVTSASVDEKCYVTASIPANSKATIPHIGFIAHLDTSCEAPGHGILPQIIECYHGGDIRLPNTADTDVFIRVDESPSLEKCIGHTLITSDGRTLL
ncbi:MAG: peptidase T, partial [Oligoflexia bacterium]|nr:peptidase T [Oligoflexia bacterium]